MTIKPIFWEMIILPNSFAHDKLLLLRSLLQSPLVAALADEDWPELSALLAERYKGEALPAGNPAAACIWQLLQESEGFFARRAAAGPVEEALLQAMADELALLQELLAAYQPPAWLNGPEAAASWLELEPRQAAGLLADFHRYNGFGRLALHRIWRWQDELVPVPRHDEIKISDLVGYQSQKEEVLANTRLLVEERRGNNLLLYGARGTGKSSLIKAVANELAAAGLCLVELPLEYMATLPQLLQRLSDQPRPYIIFIDDLSFEKADHSYKVTKAVLEGSVSVPGRNVLIYATSNRRHLIVENWADREGVEHHNGEVRASDSMSEKLSLADRFGQTVLFTTPNQEEYLQIVAALAAADGVKLPPEELRTRALQWALWQNGCSGRTARQFVNSLQGERQ